MPVGISALNQRTVDVNLHFSKTWRIAIGQQLRFAEKWLWSAGFAYDGAPVFSGKPQRDSSGRSSLRYGTGIQNDINRDITAGAAWEFLDAGPAPLSNDRGPAGWNAPRALLNELS